MQQISTRVLLFFFIVLEATRINSANTSPPPVKKPPPPLKKPPSPPLKKLPPPLKKPPPPPVKKPPPPLKKPPSPPLKKLPPPLKKPPPPSQQPPSAAGYIFDRKPLQLVDYTYIPNNTAFRTYWTSNPNTLSSISIRYRMSPVKNQQGRGTCTAFTAIGLLEASLVGRQWSEQCLAFDDNTEPSGHNGITGSYDPGNTQNRLTYAFSNPIYDSKYCPYNTNDRTVVPFPRDPLHVANNALISTKTKFTNKSLFELTFSVTAGYLNLWVELHFNTSMYPALVSDNVAENQLQYLKVFINLGYNVAIGINVYGNKNWWASNSDISPKSKPSDDEICDFYNECIITNECKPQTNDWPTSIYIQCIYSKNKCPLGQWPWGTNCPGHAVVVSGYDDYSKTIEIKNSWGSTWKDKGYGNLTYDYLVYAMQTGSVIGYIDTTYNAVNSKLVALWASAIF